MNKAELVKAVADKTNQSQVQAQESLDAVFETIKEAMQKGDRVALVGFGTFEVRKRKARQGRNPRTGEPIQIPAANQPGFKPGKALKDAVN